MGRKRLESGEKLVLLRVYVKEKYLNPLNALEINYAVNDSLSRISEQQRIINQQKIEKL